MFIRLLILFSVFPLIEIAVLIKVGALIGLVNTIVLVVLTAVIGAYLAKRQGVAVVTQIRQQLSMGRIPTDSLLDGLCILIAAIVLITPGLLTDAFGFTLLVPFTRQKVCLVLKRLFVKRIYPHT